jgi:ubiquinone/menaquinone biosynthesis C-methylase UbiE
VGFYSQAILPRLCDFLLDTPLVIEQRRQLLAHAGGSVLEIGFGTGLNLPHYPAQVRKITAVDPNPGMRRLAQKRIQATPIDIDPHLLAGERLPFADNAFDCVVSTFTLCTIDDVGQALREVYRVLKPGGHYLLLEHGLSPEPRVQKWQRRFNWLQMRLGDGCRLDRNMRELVQDNPYTSVEIDEFYLGKLPKTHGYMFRGKATK